ncbi:MAG: exosortase/archaeosortase family protein [Chloroflexota bacterium]|nr:exosortase/archaeosortase family protein [Chloroflexota bacterium]
MPSVSLGTLIVVCATLAAYNYSLGSLLRGLTFQTPLAYLAVVPLIALLLAWARLLGRGDLPSAPELRLDFILGRLVGIILMAVAAAVVLLVPTSVQLWLARVDLLSLPIFVAGAITSIYGVRRAWELRVPIGFLLLAWPIPYLPLLGHWMGRFTEASISMLEMVSVPIPIAESIGTEGLFRIRHAGGSFLLSIGAACAGVNGLVGFGIVGLALLAVARGSVRRKTAWLAVGLAVVWLTNLVRIELIFAAGWLFGEAAAYEVLHPAVGLLTFNLGVFGMLALVRRFGLTFASRSPAASAHLERPPSPARRWASLAAIVPLVATIGLTNASYGTYEPVAGGFGQPRLAGFDYSESQVDAWTSALLADYGQARQFFGDDASWQRFLYQPTGAATLTSSVPVYVDVMSTSDPRALAAYGLEACYQFHGYVIEGSGTVSIGNGVDAQIIDLHIPMRNTDWSALWWEWPYQAAGEVRYERIVVIVENGPQAEYRGVAAAAGAGDRFGLTEHFLAAMGRDLASNQLAQMAAAP